MRRTACPLSHTSSCVLHRYLVRWAGYEPEWEYERMEGHGQVGDPIETWEPWATVKNTEAYLAWEDLEEW